MTLTTLGWAVVHSLWLCTVLAALTALVLSLLPDTRARARHVVACVGLVAMTMAPIGVALTEVDPLGQDMRRPVVQMIEDTVGMQPVVTARGVVVPLAAVLWLVGVTVCVLRMGVEWRRARTLARTDLEDPGAAIHAVVAELRRSLGVPAAVDVRRSRRASVPMMLGWLRPIILLPAGTADTLPPRQLRAILAHELAHVKRRDYPANVLQIAAEALLFHHPAARWVSRRIRTEREYCCDDVAVHAGAAPADYARALAALDDARDDCRLAVAAASGTLLDRIQRIVGHPRPTVTPARAAAVMVAAAMLASVILALAAAVPPDLPLDVKLRSKNPGPGMPRPAADDASLPRKMPQ